MLLYQEVRPSKSEAPGPALLPRLGALQTGSAALRAPARGPRGPDGQLEFLNQVAITRNQSEI